MLCSEHIRKDWQTASNPGLSVVHDRPDLQVCVRRTGLLGRPMLRFYTKSNVVKLHGTGQRNHRRITFRDFVKARDDASVLFQLAKHTFNDIVLRVLGPVKTSRQIRLGFPSGLFSVHC